MVYGRYNYIYYGLLNQLITAGAPPCLVCKNHSQPIGIITETWVFIFDIWILWIMNIYYDIYIHIYMVNDNISLTWNKAILGKFPLLTMIPGFGRSEVVIIYPYIYMSCGWKKSCTSWELVNIPLEIIISRLSTILWVLQDFATIHRMGPPR